MKTAVYTVGHSTRAIEDFVALLEAYRIQIVADVRTIAGSRHNPQFNAEQLSKSLARNGIGYEHMKGLGGLRHTSKESINLGWRNPSFRGYADYMQTAEFAENIRKLIETANEKRTAIMCSEAVPWRCHRSLIGDALLVRNVAVVDIISEKSSRPHELTPFARVIGREITYPATEPGSG